MTPIENVLARLGTVTKTGPGKFRARCPVPTHPDKRPSLDVDLGKDGRVLVQCRSKGLHV
jgi:hypothetical protein